MCQYVISQSNTEEDKSQVSQDGRIASKLSSSSNIASSGNYCSVFLVTVSSNLIQISIKKQNKTKFSLCMRLWKVFNLNFA